MEDAHICLPSLPSEGLWKNIAMFCVLDGHGGEQVARYCRLHLPRACVACPIDEGRSEVDAIREALITSFQKMDELLMDRERSEAMLELLSEKKRSERQKLPNADMIGCTCCLSCITETRIHVANCGDSRAVLCRAGEAVALSEDHKPNMPVETERITKAGGYIETQPCSMGTQYRVNGNLNLSRALGDLAYKKNKKIGPEAQIISGTPDVLDIERSPDDEFMVICCDGVWDVKSNQEVVDFVRQRLIDDPGMGSEGMAKILEDLLDSCVSRDLKETMGLGGDNMTAVLVRFPGAEVTVAQCPMLVSAMPSSSSRTEGSLGVLLKLPDWSQSDFWVDICEATAELEVHHRRHEPWKVSLAGSLPAGARLVSSEAPAKFNPKSGALRTRLLWRR